jgi:hypothetical protein
VEPHAGVGQSDCRTPYGAIGTWTIPLLAYSPVTVEGVAPALAWLG